VVALPTGAWRPYAGPAALLLAVTIGVAVARPALRHHQADRVVHRPAAHPGKTTYRVHAGDTLESIARKLHVPLARLQRLNPGLQPTALFIGQKLRVR